VNATLAESFGLDRPRGALVSNVEAGGAGEKAGLQSGDIILKYDGKEIDRSADLPLLVADTPAGKSATVEVWRNRAAKTLSVAPAAGKAENEAVAGNDTAAHGRLGVAVRPLSADERRENGGKGGLVVEQVSGAAARAGIQPGDLLLSFNGTPLKSAEELRTLVGKAGRSAALLVQREDRQLFVPVELG
jgi:serine protease Do